MGSGSKKNPNNKLSTNQIVVGVQINGKEHGNCGLELKEGIMWELEF
jgi:hypothetical protein